MTRIFNLSCNSLYIIFSFILLFSTQSFGEQKYSQLKIEAPEFVLKDIPFKMTISILTENGSVDTCFNEKMKITGLYKRSEKKFVKMDSTSLFRRGSLVLENVTLPAIGTSKITVSHSNNQNIIKVRVLPGFFSLLPPIIAIVLALLLKQVLIALFSGIWLGSTFIYDYNPFTGFIRTLDTFLINALSEPSHTAIVIFSMTLGGMVGVISKAGGAQGIVKLLSRFANNRRGGQIATWAMGIFIFFDDYANTLIVGNTMRPFTDKLHISREKLSYIVDSTAAPVASIAIISSWVGFQIGLIGQAFQSINITNDPYIIFIRSIPYASYSILAIIFVFLTGITLRDMFSMHKAEKRSILSGEVLRKGANPIADSKTLDIQADKNIPLRWYNAFIPIMSVIVVTLIGLYYGGISALGENASKARLGEIIGAANSFDVLMWASFTGAIIAIILAVSQKILSVSNALNAWLDGVKAMVIAMIILILAWSIGDICKELNTADYVINITKEILSPHFLPFITFIIAAFIGFATGTSWATMAILVPIVIPAAHKLTNGIIVDPSIANSIMLSTIAAVLSGSVFGDHCSPISDTTIMSSMASAADHIDHVRTQLPYALLIALVASAVGYIPAGFGFNVWISLGCGIILLIIILYLLGKKVKK